MPATSPEQSKATSSGFSPNFSQTFKGKKVPIESGNSSKSKKKFKLGKRVGIGPERNRIPWSGYLKKLVKQTPEIYPEVKVKGITKDALNILNSMTSDVITRLAKETKEFTINTETRKLNAKAIYAAAKLMMTPEMNHKACEDVNGTMREFAESLQQAKMRRHALKEEIGGRPQPEALRRGLEKKREMKERRMQQLKKRWHGEGSVKSEEQAEEVAEPEQSQAEPVMSPAPDTPNRKLRRIRKAEDVAAVQSPPSTPTPAASPQQEVHMHDAIGRIKKGHKFSPDSEGTTTAPGSQSSMVSLGSPSPESLSSPEIQ